MKSEIYKNGISTKLPNKRIITIDLNDGTYQLEIFRHINKDETKPNGENDKIASSCCLRGVVLYGTIRLTKETLEVLHEQISAILDFDNFKNEVKKNISINKGKKI